jgi:hypothetical protein
MFGITAYLVPSVVMFSYLALVKVKGARGSVVVKALCYKPEGRGFETR